MIVQIFQFLAQFWRQLLPWYVLDTEQCGFIRQLGKYHHAAEHGWHYKHPIFQTLDAESQHEYTLVCDPQSLTTKDGVEVVVRATVRCYVYDARSYILNVDDGRQNMKDLVGGEVGWLVPRRTAKEVLSGAVLPDLVKRSAKASRAWGIHVETVRWLDAAPAPSFRLWSNNIASAGQE